MAEIATHGVVGPIFKAAAGAAMVRGDLVYYSASNDDYRLADADDETTYATFVVVDVPGSSAVVDGDEVWLAREAYFEVDLTDNLTEDAILYLSTTAGSYTSTRPTTEDDLVQIVGRVITTVQPDPDANEGNIVHLWGAKVWEYHMSLMPHSNASGGTSTFGAFDSGAHGSVILNEANERAHYHCHIPNNMVALAAAYYWNGADGATNPNASFDVDSGGDDEQHDNTNDTIAAAEFTAATQDNLRRIDISAGLNASGLLDPGRHLAIAVNNTGTVAMHAFSISLQWRCV